MLTSVGKDFKISKNYWKKQLKDYLDPNFRNKSFLVPAKLEFKPLSPADLAVKPYTIAIDTETYEKNGNLICICNSENDSVLYGTVTRQPSIHEYFDYLAKLSEGKKNVNFFAYNLKFDASIILKSIGEHLEEFYEDEFFINIDGLKIKYLNKKCLSMSRGKRNVIIFDALQYFLGAGVDGRSTLEAVSTEYLGEHKDYQGKYKDKKFPDLIEHEELNEIVKYCKIDCTLTKRIMDIWIEAFYKSFNFYPNRFYSAGFVSVQLLKTRLLEFPTFRKAPYSVQEMAYKSYFGGRFEIMSKGFMKNIHHYDIKSAYPKAMSVMPDFNRGKWITIRDKQDYKKGYVGYYKIKVNVKEKDVAPFLFRNPLGQVLTPQDEFITYTTGMELDKALEYYDFDLKKIEGYYFIPDYNEPNEFNSLIEEMYNTRMTQKNKGQKYVYKIILNSVYGKTAQARPEPKGLFSPIVCSYVTGYCRSQLLDVAKDNKENIKMFATDGIFSNKKLNLPIGNKLGEFDYTLHPKFILLMAGIYSHNTLKDKEMKTRSRGFGLRIFDDKGNESKFDLDNFKLKFNGIKYYYEIKNIRPVALTTALIQKQYDYHSVGKFEFIKKEIDINGDRKRLWFKLLKDIYDYSDSECIKFI